MQCFGVAPLTRSAEARKALPHSVLAVCVLVTGHAGMRAEQSGRLSAPICADICGGFNLSPCGCSAERAPEHSFYKSFSFWLLCNERCFFLARTHSLLLSVCCHSELLAVRYFAYRETEFFLLLLCHLLETGLGDLWGGVQGKYQ